MAAGADGKAEVLVRIHKRTLKALKETAKKNGRSRNSEIVVVLSRYVEEQKAAQGERQQQDSPR